MTSTKKLISFKKREVIDDREIVEKIDRYRNEQGYPIFNDFLLRKIFTYFEIHDLLKFSELCWKFRLLVTERMNRTWQYYYLNFKGEAPIERLTHCYGLYRRNAWSAYDRYNLRYKLMPTSQAPLILSCVHADLRLKHGYPGVWSRHNNNNNNAAYQTWAQTMSTQLDLTTIPESEVFPLQENSWNDKTTYRLSPECQYSHALEQIPYPADHRVYALKYDKNTNYFWSLSNEFASKLNSLVGHSYLKRQSTNLERKIERLNKQKEEIDRILKLHQFAEKHKAEQVGPVYKQTRFHMFRDVYRKKHGTYLSVKEASQLWAQMSDSEKEKYASIAEIQYEDGMKKKELSKVRF
jgi:hypothetical protein